MNTNQESRQASELRQVIKKANEYILELCVGYIDRDYEKAFDSVEDLYTVFGKVE